MIAGEVYSVFDKELVQASVRARMLTKQYVNWLFLEHQAWAVSESLKYMR